MPDDQSDPIENYLTIRNEVATYADRLGIDLASRPEIVTVSKSELPGSEEIAQRLAERAGVEVLRFSSATGEGLKEVVQRVWETLHPAT